MAGFKDRRDLGKFVLTWSRAKDQIWREELATVDTAEKKSRTMRKEIKTQVAAYDPVVVYITSTMG